MIAAVFDGRWIRIVLYPYVKPNQKTFVYHVQSKDPVHKLGEIRWWGRWRRYAFFPSPNTLYEHVCLRDIADFIDVLMRDRRRKRS